MRRLLDLLRQPYPLPEGPAVQLRRALLIGVFVGAFLLLFQPFGLNDWRVPQKALKVAGFGLVSTLVTFGWYVGGQWLAPNFFREDRWTVGRSALYLNLNVLLIGIANLLYLSWQADVPLQQLHPGGMIAITFLIGAFPVAGVTLATYIRQLRLNQTAAAALLIRSAELVPAAESIVESASVSPSEITSETTSESATNPPPSNGPIVPPPATVTFTAENGKDSLTVPVAQLLYLEAADNYCTVVYGPAGSAPVLALLRASLSRLAGQAAEQGTTRLTRVHRSYLVQLDRVTRVAGNAQGYRLHLPVPDVEPVPVGRTYAEAVLAALRAAPVRP